MTGGSRFGFGQIEANTADEDCPVGNGKSASRSHIPHARRLCDQEIDPAQSLAAIVGCRDKPKARMINVDPKFAADRPGRLPQYLAPLRSQPLRMVALQFSAADSFGDRRAHVTVPARTSGMIGSVDLSAAV